MKIKSLKLTTTYHCIFKTRVMLQLQTILQTADVNNLLLILI